MSCLDLSSWSTTLSTTTYKGQQAKKAYFNMYRRENHYPHDFTEGASFRMMYHHYPDPDAEITGSIVSVKNGNGAPGTLAHCDPDFELVIDAGDKGLFVLGAEHTQHSLRARNHAQAKLQAFSVCPRAQAALQRGNQCLT